MYIHIFWDSRWHGLKVKLNINQSEVEYVNLESL